jgi:hypothetical protein
MLACIRTELLTTPGGRHRRHKPWRPEPDDFTPFISRRRAEEAFADRRHLCHVTGAARRAGSPPPATPHPVHSVTALSRRRRHERDWRSRPIRNIVHGPSVHVCSGLDGTKALLVLLHMLFNSNRSTHRRCIISRFDAAWCRRRCHAEVYGSLPRSDPSTRS